MSDESEDFCRKHGVKEGDIFDHPQDGHVVFSRIGGTGMMICHPEGEPDTQSSWAMAPADFAGRYYIHTHYSLFHQ